MRWPPITTAQIRAARSPKAPVDPWQPQGWFLELECSAAGRVEPVLTILLTNRECPWTCVFCDLWKHTLDDDTPRGAIPAQMAAVRQHVPTWPSCVKLYNAGNFFDPRAIPVADYGAIAELLQGVETVIVENHPRLTDDRVKAFRDLLSGQLEVALGLETVHPQILPWLNKQLTVDEYQRAVHWLRNHDCQVRTFILLRPPGVSDAEGIHWAVRSLEAAFAAGSHCCSVIPMRGGNGTMERLQQEGWFAPPSLKALYDTHVAGLRMRAGRVFVDLWNIESLWDCPACGPSQTAALRAMNLTQQIVPWPACHCR
jgi:radical SAM enzyme (TIGR01210 family)